MSSFPRWKITLILLVCLAGVVFTLPNMFSRATLDSLPDWLPKRQISLGLDLQGGAQLLLEVDLSQLAKDRLEELVNEVRVTLRAEQIGYTGLGVQGDAVALTLTDAATSGKALAALEKLNADSAVGALNALTGGAQATGKQYDITGSNTAIRIALSETGRNEMARRALTQSLEVVRRRIDELGTRETTIQIQGNDRILVQVPGERNPENIKRLLGKTARLTFHMVDMNANVAEAQAGKIPPGSMLLQGDEPGTNGQPTYYVVKKKVDLSGENLTDAQPAFNQNEPVVSFRFDSVGARKFGQITKDNVGKLFAIVLDDKVVSAPRINEPILGGSGQISGSFTVQSAQELSVLLRAGALPAPLTVVEERSVGPDLGADSIRAGTIATFVAGAAVILLMFFYYGVFGLIADAALIVNLFLVLGVMSLLGATLTLPGIAGIVLTIGQAVDSNVLIYERIREEQRSGKTPHAAITTGFSEALRTIVDANLTSLIKALVLFQFGTGPVKGFAVTLGIGILTTMFTATTFSRLLVMLWFRRTRPATLPL